MKSLIRPILSLVAGLVLSLIIATLVGENSISALITLISGSVGGLTQIGYSLFYATPLIFTGLSVAWAFRAGLFNIGAEGQMAVGGLAMAAVGIYSPLPAFFTIPLVLLTAFLVGGAWGALAGWLKVYRQCHEVLATILLNFVAYGLTSYLIVGVLKNPHSQNPETLEIGAAARLAAIEWLGGKSALSWAFFAAVAAALIFDWVMQKTDFGLHQRLVGGGEGLARSLGFNVGTQKVLSLFIAGGFAGLAGAPMIMGYTGKAEEGFTAGLGFMGIAVALVGMNRGVGVLLAALLFGALSKGAIDLDLDSKFLSRDLAVVIQALVIVFIAMKVDFRSWVRRRT